MAGLIESDGRKFLGRLNFLQLGNSFLLFDAGAFPFQADLPLLVIDLLFTIEGLHSEPLFPLERVIPGRFSLFPDQTLTGDLAFGGLLGCFLGRPFDSFLDREVRASDSPLDTRLGHLKATLSGPFSCLSRPAYAF